MDIMAGGALDERVDTVMATVLREGVTNVLRHSSARNCSIETSEAGGVLRLRIANDGVTRAIEGGARRGGLENLSLRLAAIGGRLTTTIDGTGISLCSPRRRSSRRKRCPVPSHIYDEAAPILVVRSDFEGHGMRDGQLVPWKGNCGEGAGRMTCCP